MLGQAESARFHQGATRLWLLFAECLLNFDIFICRTERRGSKREGKGEESAGGLIGLN